MVIAVALSITESTASSNRRQPAKSKGGRVRFAWTLEARAERGFTFLEVFVVAVIIAILAALLLPVFSTMRARAQRVQCMANLRSLYIAAESYVQQYGSWPQIPVSDSDSAEQDYANAWIAALAPFGPTQKTWICPTIQELLQNPESFKTDRAFRLDHPRFARRATLSVLESFQ